MTTKPDMIEFILGCEFPDVGTDFHEALEQSRIEFPESDILCEENRLRSWKIYVDSRNNDDYLANDNRHARIDSFEMFSNILGRWISRETKLFEIDEIELIDIYYNCHRNKKSSKMKGHLIVRDHKAFYNHPDSDADFSVYADFPFFTAEEASALSFGKDPRVVNRKSLDQVSDKLPFVGIFNQRVEVLTRYSVHNGSGNLTAYQLLEWANLRSDVVNGEFIQFLLTFPKVSIVSHDDLAVLEDYNKKLKDENNKLKQDLALFESIENPSSLRSIYTLILGMAVARFGHIPKDMRTALAVSGTSNAKLISQELKYCGLNIGEETVLRWLEEGYKKLGVKIRIPEKRTGR